MQQKSNYSTDSFYAGMNTIMKRRSLWGLCIVRISLSFLKEWLVNNPCKGQHCEFQFADCYCDVQYRIFSLAQFANSTGTGNRCQKRLHGRWGCPGPHFLYFLGGILKCGAIQSQSNGQNDKMCPHKALLIIKEGIPE